MANIIIIIKETVKQKKQNKKYDMKMQRSFIKKLGKKQ